MSKLAAAKVFVVNGLGFEGWLSRLSKSSGFKGPDRGGQPGREGAGHGRRRTRSSRPRPRPHRPARLAQPAKRQTLRQQYRARSPRPTRPARTTASAPASTASSWTRWTPTPASALPPSRPASAKVLTSHDAFGYLAQRYQIRFLSRRRLHRRRSLGQNRGQTGAPGESRKIRAVFVENMATSACWSNSAAKPACKWAASSMPMPCPRPMARRPVISSCSAITSTA